MQVIGVGLVVALLAAACGDPDSFSAPKAVAPAVNHAGMAGMHHLDPDKVAPVTPLRSGERFQTLMMPKPYVPDPPTAGGTDDYRCFLVDPHLTSTVFLTGSQFLPDNADIVHHAIFFKLDARDVAQAKALDAAAPGDGYTCFSGTGLENRKKSAGAPWLASWAPGATESLTAKGTGYELEPGSQVIMQVHYNLLATNGRATSSDRSGIRLRMTSGRGLEPLHTTLLTAPIELPCPKGESGPLCDRDMAVFDTVRRFGEENGTTVAGLNLLCNQGRAPKPGNTQHCDRTSSATMVVHAVAGHMHLLGRSIKVELNPGTAKSKTLLDVPVYNFDDQGARPVKKPVTIRPGDTMRVTCTHDATLRARTPALKTLKPRYVVWGEGTSDEMCLGIVIWSAKPAA